MSERIRTVTAIAVIALSLGLVVVLLASGESGSVDRAHALAVRLKCPVCESESIADSPSQVARDAYDLIVEQIQQGQTDDEILEFFVAAYGSTVLLDPPARGVTATLWVAPLVAVAVGGLVIARRRAPDPPEATEEDRRHVRRLLEEQ